MLNVHSPGVVWYLPAKKNPLYITIPNFDTINLSPQLAEVMPERIAFGALGIGQIYIEQNDDGYRVRKDGSIKISELVAALVKGGLSLPAKYAVTAEDAHWFAKLELKPAPPVIDPAKTSNKPRKKGLKKLLDGGNPNEDMR